jgi:hypothetical protein
MADKMRRVLIFYGWPSSINGLWEPKACAKAFAQFDDIVMPHNVEEVTHGDHANTTKIMYYIKQFNPEAKIYGYIPLKDVINLGFDKIESKISSWKSMGADGIFCDEFGFDYFEYYLGRRSPTNDRETQNRWLDLVHSYEMGAVINGWSVPDVFDEQNCGPIHYNPQTDIYVSESVPFHSATDANENAQLKFADSSSVWYKSYQLNVKYASKQIKWWMVSTWEPNPNDARSEEEQFADAWEYALLMAYTQSASGVGVMRKWYYSGNGRLLPVLPDPYGFKAYKHNNTYGYYPNSSYDGEAGLLRYTLSCALGLTEAYYRRDSKGNYSIPVYTKFGNYAEFELLHRLKPPRKFYYFNVGLPYAVPGLIASTPSGTINTSTTGRTTLQDASWLAKPSALVQPPKSAQATVFGYDYRTPPDITSGLVVYDLKAALGRPASGALYLRVPTGASYCVYLRYEPLFSWGEFAEAPIYLEQDNIVECLFGDALQLYVFFANGQLDLTLELSSSYPQTEEVAEG